MYAFIMNPSGQIRAAEYKPVSPHDESGLIAVSEPISLYDAMMDGDPERFPMRTDWPADFDPAEWHIVPPCPQCGYDGDYSRGHACGFQVFVIETNWLRHNVALAMANDASMKMLIGRMDSPESKQVLAGLVRGVTEHVSNNAKQLMLSAMWKEAQR